MKLTTRTDQSTKTVTLGAEDAADLTEAAGAPFLPSLVTLAYWLRDGKAWANAQAVGKARLKGGQLGVTNRHRSWAETDTRMPADIRVQLDAHRPAWCPAAPVVQGERL